MIPTAFPAMHYPKLALLCQGFLLVLHREGRESGDLGSILARLVMSCLTLGCCPSKPHVPPNSPVYLRGYGETQVINGQENTTSYGNTGAVIVPAHVGTRDASAHWTVVCLDKQPVKVPSCPIIFSPIISESKPWA